MKMSILQSIFDKTAAAAHRVADSMMQDSAHIQHMPGDMLKPAYPRMMAKAALAKALVGGCHATEKVAKITGKKLDTSALK
jgi:hypothetical protein